MSRNANLTAFGLTLVIMALVSVPALTSKSTPPTSAQQQLAADLIEAPRASVIYFSGGGMAVKLGMEEDLVVYQYFTGLQQKKLPARLAQDVQRVVRTDKVPPGFWAESAQEFMGVKK